MHIWVMHCVSNTPTTVFYHRFLYLNSLLLMFRMQSLARKVKKKIETHGKDWQLILSIHIILCPRCQEYFTCIKANGENNITNIQKRNKNQTWDIFFSQWIEYLWVILTKQNKMSLLYKSEKIPYVYIVYE